MKPTQEQLNDPQWWDDNAPEGYDYAYTTGPIWSKNNLKSLIGTVQFADSQGYQQDNEQLCLRDDCWVLLTRRPTKPAFVPEVGVECEYSVLKGVYSLGEVLKVTKPDSFNVYAIMDSKTNQLHWATDIRPVKSERELLIEIIQAHGNLSEGVLADGILSAGFCLKEADK